MGDQRKEMIEQIETEVLIELLLKKFPDMPNHLKKGLNSLSRESLIAYVLKAFQDSAILPFNQNGPGAPTVVYVKVEKIVVKTPDEVFGDDEDMKNFCRKISKFLKGKDLGKLSEEDRGELAAINKKVLHAFVEKYPELQAEFDGFRVLDDCSDVLLGFKVGSDGGMQ